MIDLSESERRRGFAIWLRTGRLPSIRTADGIERKFNPWHDPTDGRFTFAGAGRRSGGGQADATGREDRRPSTGASRAPILKNRRTSRTTTPPMAETSPAGPPTGKSHQDPITEFVGGVGEGLYGFGAAMVSGIQAVVTTNPVTIVRDAGRGIASTIDAAIAAEDTPARIQVSRAASAVANASARDIGRTAGTVAGNVALATAPGAVLSKVAALRRLRMARPRATYDPPQIGWVKETNKSKKPWKPYNDSATGARPGQAPTLTRTMPDGSKRPVKSMASRAIT